MRRLVSDRSGNFGLMTALLLVPIIGAAGFAIDYSRALTLKSTLQDIADSAALAGVSDVSPAVKEAMLMPGDGEVPVGTKDALNFMTAQTADEMGVHIDEVNATVRKEDNVISSVVSYKATLSTSLARILGKDSIEVSGSAKAVYQTQKFRDFFLLLDNTPSMGVGATPGDVSKMIANTSDQCAFACHVVKDGVSDPNSYYNLAKKLGVTTRINVVAQATAALMDTAASSRQSSNQYRMAVYTFGEKAEDTKLLEVSALTMDLAAAKKSASQIELMSIPYQGYDNDQQTEFDRALKQVGDKMGAVGTGLSAASPEKILFFVSDGVGDSYKPSTCTKKTTGGRCQEPIDVRACKSLKDKGYTIAVLYTTYLPLPTNGWYNSWIKPFQADISTKMEECATPGLFFEVSPTQGIAEAMNALFKRIVNAPRLTG